MIGDCLGNFPTIDVDCNICLETRTCSWRWVCHPVLTEWHSSLTRGLTGKQRRRLSLWRANFEDFSKSILGLLLEVHASPLFKQTHMLTKLLALLRSRLCCSNSKLSFKSVNCILNQRERSNNCSNHSGSSSKAPRLT